MLSMISMEQQINLQKSQLFEAFFIVRIAGSAGKVNLSAVQRGETA